MTTIVKTEGQHRGEFLLAEVEGGGISREVGTLTLAADATAADAAAAFPDGRVVKSVAGKLVPAAGTTDSAGHSDENIVGIVFGPLAGEPIGVRLFIARLAEVKAVKVKYHSVTGGGAAVATAAVRAALEKLNIISR